MKKKFDSITMCGNKNVNVRLIITLKKNLIKKFKLKVNVEGGENFLLKYKNNEIFITYSKNGEKLFSGTEKEYVLSEYSRKECIYVLSGLLRTVGITELDGKLYYGLKNKQATRSEPSLKDKIIEMFEMQNKLNNMQAGEDWRKGVSDDGKMINWSKYLYMEMFELLESIPYKHWKDIRSEIDVNNIQVEIVDGWHFFMSAALESMYKSNANEDNAVNYIYQFIEDYNFQKANRSDDLVDLTEDLIAHSIFAAKETKVIGFAGVDNIGRMLEDIIEIVDNIFENGFDDLYELYMGKNILNLFRNENGYKDGSYKKMWEYEGKEVEDNVVMQDLIKKVGPQNLKDALAEEYSKIRNDKEDVKQKILKKVKEETGKRINMSHINKRIKKLKLSGKVIKNFDTIVNSFK